jgi:hypothetical protein
MIHCTDASRGVVPLPVWDEAETDFWDVGTVAGVTTGAKSEVLAKA